MSTTEADAEASVDERSLPDRRLRLIAGSGEDAQGLLTLLDTTEITVHLPPEQPSWRHQVLALTMVDLLGRLFPRQNIVCSPEAASDPALPPGPDRLLDRLHAAADHGTLHRPTQPPTRRLTVVVGGSEPHEIPATATQGQALYVDGGGWQSYTGTVPSRLPDAWPQVPIGAMAAACRAAGILTAKALEPVAGNAPVEASVYASALTHTAGADPIDDEGDDAASTTWTAPHIDAVLAGAGSVGGAVAYALAMTPGLSGRLVVCDPQALEGQNLDRALLATAADTEAELPKVEVVEAALAHLGNLDVQPHQGKVADWIASHPEPFPLPVVLITVDALEERRAIQDGLPLDVLNAACNATEVMISGHRTGTGPCVCCLHMAMVLDAENVKAAMISRETGMPKIAVEQHLTSRPPMPAPMLRQIERHRDLAEGSLAQYEDQTLHDLWDGYLLYGSTQVQYGQATVAVAAPYVTALAGTLLAGELLKASTPGLARYRLGPSGSFAKYEERVTASPLNAILTNPARWPGAECLCRSARRQRLLNARYGLEEV
ncbi:ThiF family adenylyltransferase [Knoellia koreensis]|jgi:hypothetical protein|uniref:THIF-type NAD/FAD binding fold domain-containing protein n=1 Tax=Knoellia koreensis TaxID=2730921 RepID=A0A849HK51_9MICO|nr:ThiF family adenylyltransferase [Knoellia sp. DB2414S]NNM47033.1 hypothetical protein [Knoellia sp. DB2414S]